MTGARVTRNDCWPVPATWYPLWVEGKIPQCVMLLYPLVDGCIWFHMSRGSGNRAREGVSVTSASAFSPVV